MKLKGGLESKVVKNLDTRDFETCLKIKIHVFIGFSV